MARRFACSYQNPVWADAGKFPVFADFLLRWTEKLEQRRHAHEPSPADPDAIDRSAIDELVELGLSKSNRTTSFGDRACWPLNKGNG